MFKHASFAVILVSTLAACRSTGPSIAAPPAAGAAPLVQPGAPGEPSRAVTPAQASDLSRVPFTSDDVTFIEGMIAHHGQAIEMTNLIQTHTDNADVRRLGLRIGLSQADEISMMKRWLETRGQDASGANATHAHGEMPTPGMLTAEEMARLAGARGAAFDRLFLEGMIKHHGGALVMIEQLFSHPGAAQDSEVFAFASDVDSDQRMEIARMGAMLKELP